MCVAVQIMGAPARPTPYSQAGWLGPGAQSSGRKGIFSQAQTYLVYTFSLNSLTCRGRLFLIFTVTIEAGGPQTPDPRPLLSPALHPPFRSYPPPCSLVSAPVSTVCLLLSAICYPTLCGSVQFAPRISLHGVLSPRVPGRFR